MWHNLGFELGDPSQDGHGVWREYHIVSTHSKDQITKAYNEFVDNYGVDFTTLFQEYDCDVELPENIKELFGSLNIKYYQEYYPSEFISQFFNIIKFMIPDFEWEYRDLEETELDTLRGAGYGLFHP